MSRVLGIDPGSRLTGFGVIEWQGNSPVYITSGCIRVTEKEIAGRLGEIFTGIQQIVAEYQPELVSVEKVFVHRNVDSALKLGQARGAAICAAMQQPEIEMFEYSPTQIKKAIVGKGHASKEQVQHMVKVLLNLPGTPQEDAADALAAALCHVHTIQTVGLIQQSDKRNSRR